MTRTEISDVVYKRNVSSQPSAKFWNRSRDSEFSRVSAKKLGAEQPNDGLYDVIGGNSDVQAHEPDEVDELNEESL